MKNPLRSRFSIVLFAIVVVCVCLIIYWQLSDVPPELQYRLQSAENGEIIQTVSANGTINPVSLVNVGTQVSGRVKMIYADHNSKVKKGQILLELDAAVLEAQLRQSEANLQSAAATLDLNSANETRIRSLFAQDFVSHQELDAAVQAKKVSQAQWQSIQAQINRDKANLAYSVVRSPVSGVVIDRQVEVGQTVASSFQTPTLFKIAQDLSKMQIDASFAEADIGNIRVGQAVQFNVDAFPDQNFNGVVKLVRLNPTIQQNVVTYNVVIDVDNPRQILLPGMTAYVSITVAERKNTLLVPNAALRFRPANGGNKKPGDVAGSKTKPAKRNVFSGKVYVLEQGKPVKRNINLGITDNRNTEVVEGELKIGEKVILGETRTEDNTSTGSSSRSRLRMF